MTDLAPGDSVICIDDAFTKYQLHAALSYGVFLPVKGTQYTIRDIRNECEVNAPGVLLEEICNPKIMHVDPPGMREPAFAVRRFQKIRKVDTTKAVQELAKLTEPMKSKELIE